MLLLIQPWRTGPRSAARLTGIDATTVGIGQPGLAGITPGTGIARRAPRRDREQNPVEVTLGRARPGGDRTAACDDRDARP
jgi:hypothetical protein